MESKSVDQEILSNEVIVDDSLVFKSILIESLRIEILEIQLHIEYLQEIVGEEWEINHLKDMLHQLKSRIDEEE
jgi:hypothetical protein